MSLEEILGGQENGKESLGEIEIALQGYVVTDEREIWSTCARKGRKLRKHRELFVGFLVRQVTSFCSALSDGNSNTRSGLSLAADITTIVSTAMGWFDKSADQQYSEVTKRLDSIQQNQKHILKSLKSLQDQQQDGFKRLELVIKREFANEEFDELITQTLELESDFEAFQNFGHTSQTIKYHKDKFRNSCRSDHDPQETFKRLYRHACKDCKHFGGVKSGRHLQTTFLELAYARYPADSQTVERITWFRETFGSVVLAGMIQNMYLHTVCVYHEDGVCSSADPAWLSQLKEMGTALEEVTDHIIHAETEDLCPLPSESPTISPAPTPAPVLPLCKRCPLGRCYPRPCRRVDD